MTLPKLTRGQDGKVPVLLRGRKGEAFAVFPCEPFGGGMLAIGQLERPFAITRGELAKSSPHTSTAFLERLQFLLGVPLRTCLRITEEQQEVCQTRAQQFR